MAIPSELSVEGTPYTGVAVSARAGLRRMAKRNWTFLSSHGVVFLHIVRNPEHTITRTADALGLAERTVAFILADLRDDGYVSVSKKGKSNVYSVNPNLPMRHPSHAHYTVRDFFAILTEMAEQPGHARPGRLHYRRGGDVK